MQMGDMVRNLPQEALQTFKWDAYSKALISSLGFDPRMWVKSEDQIAQERAAMQANAEPQPPKPPFDRERFVFKTLAVVISASLFVSRQSCHARWKSSGHETSWGPFQGCLIRDGEKWIPEDRWIALGGNGD